ncbi:MAG: DNA mismatch repair endonuclease MutL [Chloroflexota bacterium]
METTARRPITIMPTALAQRIAAGEVVERPGSVVRELVENALDAGAGSITIEVRGGGIELIAVHDDGQGIPAEELSDAFARFATSKTLALEDLDGVRTLGFRGEALAAIAAVGTVTAVSATGEERSGARLLLQHGEAVEHGRVARPRGTTVRVHDLFAEHPARRKFLPSPRAEYAYLRRLARLYALARPHIRITLELDGRRAFHASGLGEAGALAAVFETDAPRLGPVGPSPIGAGILHGYLGDPGFTRPDSEGIVIVLNGRWVRPRAWLAALERAYQGLLRSGRHPVLVLYIEIDARLVDVNRHPAKLEVRVRDEEAFLGALSAVIRERLGNSAAPVDLLHAPLTRPRQRALPSPRRGLGEQPAVYGDLPDFSQARVLGQVFDTAILAESGSRLYLVDQHRADERAIYQELTRTGGPMAVQELLEPLRLETRGAESEQLETRIPELLRLGFRVERFGRRAFLIRSQPTGLPEGAASALVESLAEGLQSTQDWRDRLLIDLACRAAIKRGRALIDHEMGELLRRLQACDARAVCPHGSPIVAIVRAEDLVRHFGWPKSTDPGTNA